MSSAVPVEDAASQSNAGQVAPPPGLPGLTEVMEQAGDENFPVASRLLGRRVRGSLWAVYGFARFVDDVGDESGGDRLELLDWIDGEIDRVYSGQEPGHPVMARLAVAARQSEIPAEPLHRLVEANRRDQEVRSYASFDELLGYCALSANPVGEMVLHVFDAATPERIELSDAVCSGLQVTEHLQDVREDLARGRVYLPQEDLLRFGCTDEDLRLSPSPERIRTLIAFEVERARDLLDRGAPLARCLRGRPGLAIAGFVAGGRAALGAIERVGYETEQPPPRPSWPARFTAGVQTARAAMLR
jgi:squalene synthase HpnC